MNKLPGRELVKIAESLAEIPFNEHGLALVEAAGKTVTLALHNNELFACAHKCPHAGGILADGYLDALGNIVCPIHRYKFSLRNGRNTSGEGYFLITFPIKITGEGVYISL